jgi:hypothetical protein
MEGQAVSDAADGLDSRQPRLSYGPLNDAQRAGR